MSRARVPAVAGRFYPAVPDELRHAIEGYLLAAKATPVSPKAIIAPHAGYIYSGPVAASAYACVAPGRNTIARVVLLGPAHGVYVRGLALSGADSFVTPLGAIPIDAPAAALIRDLPQVVVQDEAHRWEHSLEVHLPFLQTVLKRFSLVPLVVGDAHPAEVSEVLELLWGGQETLIVVSSDLSHYHDYQTAGAMDRATSQAIEECRTDLSPERACGCRPVNGLLYLTRRRGLKVTTLDLRNSGDTAGPRDEVVGYGAYAIR